MLKMEDCKSISLADQYLDYSGKDHLTSQLTTLNFNNACNSGNHVGKGMMYRYCLSE